MRTPTRERRDISVRGIVQGVGFRPFVYALARRYGLTGLVRNDAEGVLDLLEHLDFDLERFLGNLDAVNPGVERMLTSARTGRGVDEWGSWLERRSGSRWASGPPRPK